MGVIIEELPEYPVKSLAIRPYDINADIGDIYSSLSFVAGAITNILLEKNIPHNLLISDKGTTIYIIPRTYEKEIHEDKIRCTWLECSGVAICRNKKFYDAINKKEFEKILSDEVSITKTEFKELKDAIFTLFSKFK